MKLLKFIISFSNNPTLFTLLKRGCKIDFTPNSQIGGWENINVMYVEKNQIALAHMVGNHVEQNLFPLTKKGLREALALLGM